MRLEVALVAGIIFFCCWCAYIIARMNSSVPAMAQPADPQEAPSRQQLQVVGQQQQQQRRQQQQQHQADRPRRGGAPSGERRQHRAQNYYLAAQQQRRLGAPTLGRTAEAGGGGGGDYAAAAAAGRRSGAAEPLGPRGRLREAQEDEDEEEAEEEAGAPGELEEREERRSFSRNEADATERDRFGNPVRVFRKHLINGRPVESPEPETAGSEAADLSSLAEEIEDDSAAADEAGAEDGQQPAERAPEQQPEGSESRLSGAINVERGESSTGRRRPLESGRASARRRSDEIGEHSDDSALPAKRRDSHQHKLRESLEAQQWDDDTATATTTTTTPQPPLDADDDDGDVERDQEPRGDQAAPPATGHEQTSGLAETTPAPEPADDISFEDLDLLADQKFPFLDGAAKERSRAKRSPVGEPIRVEWGSARRLRRVGERKQSDNDPAGAGSGGDGDGEADVSADKGRIISPSDPRDDDHSTTESGATTRASESGRPTKAAPATTNDIVVGEEDLSIELLADPPTQPPANITDDSYTAHAFHETAPANLSEPPSNGHTSAGHLSGAHERPLLAVTLAASGAPQVGRADAAAGRQVASGSGPAAAKKRPTRRGSASSRARANSKHHAAAKAASMRRKSKLKKGGLSKKSKKGGKKYAKSYKEFRGSARGKKGARGVGRRGAKKGALFYKDKGYKKRGFKKNYQKVESGDHKTYFDEFRDKDSSKKWKDFKDKHHYNHGKKWAADDRKKFKNMSAKELRDKKYGLGKWRQKEQSKYRKDYAKKSTKQMKSKAKKHHEAD